MGYGVPGNEMELADLQIIEKPAKAPREKAGSTPRKRTMAWTYQHWRG